MNESHKTGCFPSMLSTMGGYNEKSAIFSNQQKRALTRARLCWYSDLRLGASVTMRNKFLLYISPVYSILL